VNALHLIGRPDDAVQLFERLRSMRNDVGPLSEEYDPGYGRQVGNFPQAFSHVPLIQSALNLAEQAGHNHHHRRRPGAGKIAGGSATCPG
jgi:GH15 family glucan-1,4-alpha-glucosidase